MKLSKGNLGFCLSAGLGTVVLVAASVHADHVRATPLANLTPQAKQAIESANSLSSAFRAVANQLLPCVVAIENRPAVAWNSYRSAKPSSDGHGGRNPFEGTPLERMFPTPNVPSPPMNRRGDDLPAPQGGIGSGVIIDEVGNHLDEQSRRGRQWRDHRSNP